MHVGHMHSPSFRSVVGTISCGSWQVIDDDRPICTLFVVFYITVVAWLWSARPWQVIFGLVHHQEQQQQHGQ